MGDLYYIREKKQILLDRLESHIVPLLTNDIIEIYNEIRMNNKRKNYLLKEFQESIKSIKDFDKNEKIEKWNKLKLSKMDMDLIMNIFKIAYFLESKNDNIIPEKEEWLWKCYLNIARKIYRRPFLLYDIGVSKIEYQKNLIKIEKLIKVSINETFNEMIWEDKDINILNESSLICPKEISGGSMFKERQDNDSYKDIDDSLDKEEDVIEYISDNENHKNPSETLEITNGPENENTESLVGDIEYEDDSTHIKIKDDENHSPQSIKVFDDNDSKKIKINLENIDMNSDTDNSLSIISEKKYDDDTSESIDNENGKNKEIIGIFEKKDDDTSSSIDNNNENKEIISYESSPKNNPKKQVNNEKSIEIISNNNKAAQKNTNDWDISEIKHRDERTDYPEKNQDDKSGSIKIIDMPENHKSSRQKYRDLMNKRKHFKRNMVFENDSFF